MNLFRKLKNTMPLITAFVLIFTMFTSSSFALSFTNIKHNKENKSKYSKETIKTKADSKKLFAAAKAGDKDAKAYIASLKIFDKNEVEKALKSIKLTPNNPRQRVVFSDGSEIICEMKDVTKEEFESSKRKLQSVSYTNYYKQVNFYAQLLGVNAITMYTYIYWTGASDSRGWLYSRVTGMEAYQNTTCYFPFYANGTGVGLKYPEDLGRYPWADGISYFNYGFNWPWNFGTTAYIDFSVSWNGYFSFVVRK